jgi:hypothetical protein
MSLAADVAAAPAENGSLFGFAQPFKAGTSIGRVFRCIARAAVNEFGYANA